MKKQTSYYAKPTDIQRKWVAIDADGQILGRLATQASIILQGKTKAMYTPSVDTGDFVVIFNAEKIKVTGNKAEDKLYYNFSGYPGGLKSISFERLIQKKPEDVLYRAIKGMLPHNRIGRQMLKKVKIYAGSSHPHSAQNPELLTLASKENK